MGERRAPQGRLILTRREGTTPGPCEGWKERAGGCSVGRQGQRDVSRWERGKVIPGRFWLDHLAHVLGIPVTALHEAASLSRVNRRAFLSLTTLAATHGSLAAEMVSSVAGSDPIPLTTVQTTHNTDLVIASMVDARTTVRLRRWMYDGDNPVLRANATGILAKLPGQDTATEVATVLDHDAETRQLYMTAVVARICALDWRTAGRLANNPRSLAGQGGFVASRLATEVLNPRDAGARWCSATMLRDLSPQLG